MNLALTARIGWRYWRSRKANAFASFITFFSVLGIVLGVASLIIVSSVMNGLENQLKTRILGSVPQVIVTPSEPTTDWDAFMQQFKGIEGVNAISPLVQTQAMLQSRNQLAGAQVYGIQPQSSQEFHLLQDKLLQGDVSLLQAGEYGVMLGLELARTLQVGVGDKVRLFSGSGVVYSPMGPVPSQRNFRVIGVFKMGSVVDKALAFVHYADGARLMRKPPSQLHSVRLFLDDPFAAEQVTQTIANSAPELVVQDWQQNYGHLFAAVKMEKRMMSLMLSLIVAVAAFNIVSALVMMVMDKSADIAILKTQGMTTTQVMQIFLVQGMLNALIGLVLGGAIGMLIAPNLNQILTGLGVSLLGPGVTLPVLISQTQIGGIVAGTLIISLLATLYPAIKAASIRPAETLRYE
ncbi:lipoprotein-releasing ABC transporter permease subunit [Paraferrimonas sedimenticola]|uniref:ABC transporter substrate-binding protein n=1 Tax=Paraferrimonas sedimenticola TaxID=375674 RepID=A0AA37VWJ5_9GAMM|nr:lipoprotein-releasing ABC transporter permease subunit [Paraferrimonas sedimenticola]GLP94885.1 ABC transporter substrate-binding protein [Paraferrimonas sedimenticola]